MTIQTRIMHVQSKRRPAQAASTASQGAVPVLASPVSAAPVTAAPVYSPPMATVNEAISPHSMALTKLRDNSQLPIRMTMIMNRLQAQGMTLPPEAAKRFLSLKGALEKQLELAPLGVMSMNPNALITLIEQSIRVTVALEQKLNNTAQASKKEVSMSEAEQRLLHRLERERKPTQFHVTTLPIEHHLKYAIDRPSLELELTLLQATYTVTYEDDGGARLHISHPSLQLRLAPDYPSVNGIEGVKSPKGMIHTVTSLVRSKNQ